VSPQVDLNFQVEAPPPLGPAAHPNRIYARSPNANTRLSWLRAAPQSRCFVFNGQRYCE
jgi:hypothetical protein